MKIGIRTDREDFFYDLHSLTKSFFPDDDVSIFSADDAVRCAADYNLEITVEIPRYGSDRKEAKDSLKRSLYELLRDYTGRELPWGMLSGIRPVRIPMQMLLQGETAAACEQHLVQHDLVSEEKAKLAVSVALRERELLKDLPLGEKSYSLYVHIPFCPSICLYCTFSSSPIDKWRSRADSYLDVLLREMRVRKDRLLAEGFSGGPLTVYIGGGTPTSLSPDQLDRLLSAIEEIWDLDGAVEYTVEAGRPDSITAERLHVLMRHHVTRISVNPQTMNDKTLAMIGRAHSEEDTVRAFYTAREAGFANINMDIILGLPGEGPDELRHTLEAIEALGPDSLTVHSLAVKRASRLTRDMHEMKAESGEDAKGLYRGFSLANSELLMAMAAESASRMGMHPYYLYRQKNMRGNLENTGFSVAGKECLYNILIMEEVQTIEAFGAAASTKRVYADGRIVRSVSPKDVQTYLMRAGEESGGENRVTHDS